MVIRALTYVVLFLLTAPCQAEVKQPNSVHPIGASGTSLFANSDILGRSYDYSEQRWRVARARIVQQGQEIPTDYLDELGELAETPEQSAQPNESDSESAKLQPIPQQPQPAVTDNTATDSTVTDNTINDGTALPAQPSRNPVIFDSGQNDCGQAIQFNRSCTRSNCEPRCPQSCTR